MTISAKLCSNQDALAGENWEAKSANCNITWDARSSQYGCFTRHFYFPKSWPKLALHLSCSGISQQHSMHKKRFTFPVLCSRFHLGCMILEKSDIAIFIYLFIYFYSPLWLGLFLNITCTNFSLAPSKFRVCKFDLENNLQKTCWVNLPIKLCKLLWLHAHLPASLFYYLNNWPYSSRMSGHIHLNFFWAQDFLSHSLPLIFRC